MTYPNALFGRRGHKNDIGLIKLARAIHLDESVAAICLPDPSYKVSGGESVFNLFSLLHVLVCFMIEIEKKSGEGIVKWERGRGNQNTILQGFGVYLSCYGRIAGNVVVSGWGVTREGGKRASPVLRVVSVPFVPDQECARDYATSWSFLVGSSLDANTMFCAGYPEGGKDACQVDVRHKSRLPNCDLRND